MQQSLRWDHVTTVAVTLFISAIFALLLLTAGQRVARVTVFLTAAALFFLLLLGILQFMSETDGALGFSQCVLPFAIALVLGVVLAAVVLSVVSNLPWMLAWLLGFMGGCLIMFFVRDHLLANHPQLINNPSFRFYWITLLVVGVLMAQAAVRVRPHDTHASAHTAQLTCSFDSARVCQASCLQPPTVLLLVSVSLGAYMLSISVAGLVIVFGGDMSAGGQLFLRRSILFGSAMVRVPSPIPRRPLAANQLPYCHDAMLAAGGLCLPALAVAVVVDL